MTPSTPIECQICKARCKDIPSGWIEIDLKKHAMHPIGQNHELYELFKGTVCPHCFDLAISIATQRSAAYVKNRTP